MFRHKSLPRSSSLILCKLRATSSPCPTLRPTLRLPDLYSPPRQRLPDPLGHKQPVVSQFARRLAVGFGCVAAGEVVVINLNLVVRVDLGGDYLCLLLVGELRPAPRS